MERDLFNYVTRDFAEDGVKKACYVVREYRRCGYNGAVTEEEVSNALDIILAHSYETSDENTTVELWKCDGDCNRNYGLDNFCPGEFHLTKKNDAKFCKYYSDPFDDPK